MAFNGAYTAVQQSTISNILFTDTSTGSDGGLTERRIYPYKSDGTLLLPTGNTSGYIVWPIANSTIIVNLLSKDYALNITVLWISSSPLAPPSTYTLTTLYGFTGYTQEFIYERVQDISANNAIINDSQYYESLSKLQTEVSNVGLSVTYGSITNAQAALDRARYLIQNQSKFF